MGVFQQNPANPSTQGFINGVPIVLYNTQVLAFATNLRSVEFITQSLYDSLTYPAAGIAALIKTALALYHKTLPATLHCENPNARLKNTPFYVNTTTRPWIHGSSTPRRAGVNAFGFGGINAHAILEEYCPHER